MIDGNPAVADFARIVGGNPADPYHLDVVSAVDLAARPPTVTLGVGDLAKPVPFLGNPWDYHPGQTVAWITARGAPLVLGPVPGKGAGDVLDPDDTALDPVIAPVLQNGWANYGAEFAGAGYWRQPDGWVCVHGLVRNGVDGTAIFTLPEGYRPTTQFYFVSHSNGVACVMTVETTGVVRKHAGGSNAYVSLSGIMFPTAWNRPAWTVPSYENNWTYDDTYTSPSPELFVRDDGWCWLKGNMAGGTIGADAVLLPENARVRRYAEILVSLSLAGQRLNVTHRGYLQPGSSINSTHILGLNWWSGRAPENLFTPLPLTNGWVNNGGNYEPGGYYRDRNGLVHLRGLVNANAKTGNVIATLPAGYRPAANHVFQSHGGSGAGTPSRVDVGANGHVAWLTGSATGYLTLAGCVFRAEQ